jgi:putative SOS response-associated peptidase YedK
MEAMLKDIAQVFGDLPLPNRQLEPSWNVKPTQDVYIITHDSIRIASWGMIAPWSKSILEAQKSQSNAINARAETVNEKPTFRNPFRRSRCLVPATGYYEWASELGEYRPRQPIYVSREDNHLLFFSAIFDVWISPDGQVKRTVSILTRAAVGALAKFHSRMPMFLSREKWDSWLDPSIRDSDTVKSLFKDPQPDANLRFWPVSNLVNSIKNNGPELIHPCNPIPETLF